MKREEALKLAEHALDELAQSLQQGQSTTLKQLLAVMARFPNYSFRNVMLIAAQRPEASRVAGFHTWKRLGRRVLKGEKGIAIVAPMVGRKDVGAEHAMAEGPAETNKDAIFGFRVVYVFDVSQTEGDELPELTRPQGDPGDRLVALEDVIRRFGIRLEYAPLANGTQGLSLKGQIVIEPGLEPAQTFAVLAHELAHELLHQPADGKRSSKSVRELEAEAVAQAVCHAFGIDSTICSSDYIGLYEGSAELLAQSLQTIQATAAHIIVELSRAEKPVIAEGLTTLAA